MTNVYQIGDRVVVSVPENARIHGTVATVREVTEWGYVLDAPAAATGTFRAVGDEVVPVKPVKLVSKHAARDPGYTGDFCALCGSDKMRRNGTCLLCESCGSTSGCS